MRVHPILGGLVILIALWALLVAVAAAVWTVIV